MRRALLVALVAGLPEVWAQDATAPPAGTLDQLADEVAGKVTTSLARLELSGAADLAISVRGVGATGRIAPLLEGLLLGRLRSQAGVRSVGLLGGGGATRASWAGYEAWLDVAVAVETPYLGVTWRLVSTDRNPWRHASDGGEPVLASAHARTRLDAELRAHLSGRPSGTAPVTQAPASGRPPAPTPPPPKPPAKRRAGFAVTRLPFDPPGPVLALASGDVDADGDVELVALTADQVLVYGLRQGSLLEEQRIALEGETPVPRPRLPAGTLVVADVEGDPTPEVLARSSEHASGVRLGCPQKGAGLAKLGAMAGFPVMVARDGAQAAHTASATLVPGLRQFARGGFALVPPWPGQAPTLPDRLVALRGTAGILAGVDADGLLRLWKLGQRGVWVQFLGTGSAMDLADLDQDGRPELITSSARALGLGDVLLVRTVRDDGTARILHKETVRGGIEAIAAGDLDGDGAIEAAVAVRGSDAGRELWLLR